MQVFHADCRTCFGFAARSKGKAFTAFEQAYQPSTTHVCIYIHLQSTYIQIHVANVARYTPGGAVYNWIMEMYSYLVFRHFTERQCCHKLPFKYLKSKAKSETSISLTD